MVTVELGLLRQKSSCWMSLTLLERSTMAATRAQTLTPCKVRCIRWEEGVRCRTIITKNHTTKPIRKGESGAQEPLTGHLNQVQLLK